MDLSRLLHAPRVPLDARELVHEYHDFCCAQTGFVDDASERHETPVAGGTAISAADAARCILDIHRTLRFVAGVDAALLQLRERFPGDELQVLYAGCGPFAALGLPFFAREGLRWTCIDVHERSLGHLQKLLQATDLASERVSLRQMDAAEVDGTYHLIVAEVMQRALQKEPQLALTAKLAPRLREGGLLVPESIRLQATLVDVSRETGLIDPHTGEALPPRRVELGPLLDLRVDTARALVVAARDGVLQLPTHEVPALEQPLHATVRTAITIHGDHALGDHDSGLTVPLYLDRVRGGERLHWRYRLGSRPGPELEVEKGVAPDVGPGT